MKIILSVRFDVEIVKKIKRRIIILNVQIHLVIPFYVYRVITPADTLGTLDVK